MSIISTTFAAPLKNRVIALAALVTVAFGALPIAAHAERVGGPGYKADAISAGYYKEYNVTFHGGRVAQIAAAGDGDIDIRVFDRFGREVARDLLDDTEPAVQFTPAYTQSYTIRVINADSYTVDFEMATN